MRVQTAALLDGEETVQLPVIPGGAGDPPGNPAERDARGLAVLVDMAVTPDATALLRPLPPVAPPLNPLPPSRTPVAKHRAPSVRAEKRKRRPCSAGRRQTSLLYTIIVAGWTLLCVALVRGSLPVAHAAFGRDTALGVIVICNTVFISYFWLNGLKDLVYPFAYRLMRRHEVLPPVSRIPGHELPLVGLLYATCNDFSAPSLAACLQQDYPRCEPVILDDSNNPRFRQQVDSYALRHWIPVVRRADRKGFKGGNLNNYLRGDGKHLDYFVIIDSDEILPRDFVSRALDYFAVSPDIGIVQANHVATRNRTTFMRTFAPGVDSHWPAYQAVKSRAGFMSLLGHGAMVSRAAYLAGNGFPPIVSEDIGFAIDARRAGYRTVFAPDITCEEEFPPDYAAFKKRHRKWTEGNMEFIRRYTLPIMFSRRLSWYEKLDIVLFTFGLPLTGIFSLYVAANAILFPLVHFSYRYPLWMIVPTVSFLLAPMINDAITWFRQPKTRLASYLLHSVALFGSVYFVSLFASLRTMFGRSVFHVTPKTAVRTGLRGALRQNAKELAAGAVLAIAVSSVSGSVLPVLLLLMPVGFGIYLSVMNAGDPVFLPDPSGKHIMQEEMEK
jgi:GT2 family glycosyltransferase